MESKMLNKVGVLFLAAALTAGCASTDSADGGADAQASQQQANQQSQVSEASNQSSAVVETVAAPVLESVFYFDFDKSTLRPEARAALDAQIAYLKGNTRSIRLEGHADERGTREYNMALGERRANAVAQYMVINGISRSRIETVSYGEERPLAFGSSEASWAKNRRVELK